MKCWWSKDDLPNTTELIKNHCQEKHNVTNDNNIIMQKACLLMQNEKLLKRFKIVMLNRAISVVILSKTSGRLSITA